MTFEIVKALIGVVGALIGIVLTTVLKSYLETRDFMTINKNRRKALKGTWKGFVSQNVTETTYKNLTVELHLTPGWKKIQGTGKVYSDGKLANVVLEGHFRNDKYLKMDYQNENRAVVQFGCFVFELSSDSVTLKGRVVGYGHKNERVIYGFAEFKKE